jgi:hypothetical protein
MSFENLFSIGASFRIALGVIFALFLVCFAAIIVEETFLGGRRRRKAIKIAREREILEGALSPPTSDPAQRN